MTAQPANRLFHSLRKIAEAQPRRRNHWISVGQFSAMTEDQRREHEAACGCTLAINLTLDDDAPASFELNFPRKPLNPDDKRDQAQRDHEWDRNNSFIGE